MASTPDSHLMPTSPATRAHIRWRQITVFVVITFAATWLVVLPLYFIDDAALFQTLYLPITVVMMGIPALVSWLIVRQTRPKGHRAAALGLNRHRPWYRFVGYMALAFILPIGIGMLSLPIASAFGLYEADFANFTGLQQTYEAAGLSGMTVSYLLTTQLLNIVIASWLLNILPALGEEIGWRGWLTPQLLPLGVVPTIGLTGVIWGLWHTPVILLGHNYPHLPNWQAVLFMVVFCTLVGGVLAWLTIRTNSVWPAALGHSTINATASLPLLFSAETSFDSAHVGIAGTSGWIVTAVLLVIFLVARSFKPAPVPELDPSTAWPGDYLGTEVEVSPQETPKPSRDEP